MTQFDPRRRPFRLSPHLLTATAALTVAGLIWRIYEPTPAVAAQQIQQMDPTAVAALEAKAFAAASARPGLDLPQSVRVKLRSGETIEQAVRRVGVAPEDAAAAAKVLRTAAVGPASAFEAAIAHPRAGRGSARLVGLTLRTGPVTSLSLSRTFDGALKLRELEEKTSEETTVARGVVAGSLFDSAAALGATRAVTNQVVKLFQHKLDFQRDIVGGDEFTLVFDRTVSESGKTVETGELLFAELESKGRKTRLYRFMHDGKWQYFDEFGKNIKGMLLRTPVEGVRVNSNFGMRRHPILGYARMHQGVDFPARSGTPILASGDGVVVEARRWGGYGNWLRIRHGGGWESGYAHVSRYAPGVRPGMRVRQGQVVAYVGSTGMSTGPHLHYETWLNGRRVNPTGVKVPAGTILTGTQLAAFQAEKARIERLIDKKEQAQAAAAVTRTAAADGLKPVLPVPARRAS